MARGYANVKFEWNGSASAVVKNLGFGKELQRDAANIIFQYSYDYMPYKSGLLSSAVRISAFDKYANITHTIKYANAQYQLVTDKRTKNPHPLATDHWYDVAYQHHKREITKDIDEARLKYRSFRYGKK